MVLPFSEALAGVWEESSVAEILAAAGNDRTAWTAIAATAFAASGFLATVVGTTVLLILAGIAGSPSSVGAPDLEAVGGAILWFAAPTIGATVTGTPAWGVLVEVLGTRLVGAKADRSKLTYSGFGGLAGAISGALAHVVMWVIIMGVVNLYNAFTGTATETFPEAIALGLLLGVFSIGFTGIITVPILGATGLGLGYARHRVSSADGDPVSSDDRHHGTDAEDGDDREGDGPEEPRWKRLEDASKNT